MVCSSTPSRVVFPATSKEAPELGETTVEFDESIG